MSIFEHVPDVVMTRHVQRLDPAVMHVSCTHAGVLLARLGRPEVTHCIEGLEQYSHAYEEAGEYAQDIRKVYAAARAGESDFAHMMSVVRGDAQYEMVVDTPISPTGVPTVCMGLVLD